MFRDINHLYSSNEFITVQFFFALKSSKNVFLSKNSEKMSKVHSVELVHHKKEAIEDNIKLLPRSEAIKDSIRLLPSSEAKARL